MTVKQTATSRLEVRVTHEELMQILAEAITSALRRTETINPKKIGVEAPSVDGQVGMYQYVEIDGKVT